MTNNDLELYGHKNKLLNVVIFIIIMQKMHDLTIKADLYVCAPHDILLLMPYITYYMSHLFNRFVCYSKEALGRNAHAHTHTQQALSCKLEAH